jgi:hypothetical protein
MNQYYANTKKTGGAYAADLHVSATRAGRYAVAVAAGWVVFPFVVRTVLMNPTDAIRAQMKLQGLPVPHVFTAQQAASGLVEAVFVLCILVLMQMICTVLFYRHAKMVSGPSVATPALWPVAALLGLLGNAAWFYGTGAFDSGGFIVGLSSAALTVGGEILCNRLGREFVLGSAAKGGAVSFFG